MGSPSNLALLKALVQKPGSNFRIKALGSILCLGMGAIGCAEQDMVHEIPSGDTRPDASLGAEASLELTPIRLCAAPLSHLSSHGWSVAQETRWVITLGGSDAERDHTELSPFRTEDPEHEFATPEIALHIDAPAFNGVVETPLLLRSQTGEPDGSAIRRTWDTSIAEQELQHYRVSLVTYSTDGQLFGFERGRHTYGYLCLLRPDSETGCHGRFKLFDCDRDNALSQRVEVALESGTLTLEVERARDYSHSQLGSSVSRLQRASGHMGDFAFDVTDYQRLLLSSGAAVSIADVAIVFGPDDPVCGLTLERFGDEDGPTATIVDCEFEPVETVAVHDVTHCTDTSECPATDDA